MKQKVILLMISAFATVGIVGCGASFDVSQSALEDYADNNDGEYADVTSEYSDYDFVEGVYVMQTDSAHVELWDLDSTTNASQWFQGNMETLKADSKSNAGSTTTNGVYIQGEPDYYNADDITDSFSEEELEIITDLLDEESLDYEEYFENAILYGSFDKGYDSATFDDGTEKDGVWYEAVAPHGYTSNILIFISEDGEIYMESSTNGSSDSAIFMTSDSSVTQMPER